MSIYAGFRLLMVLQALLISYYISLLHGVSNARIRTMSKRKNIPEKSARIVRSVGVDGKRSISGMRGKSRLVPLSIICMLYSLANNGKLSGRADGNVYMRNGRIRGMKVPALVQNAKTAGVRNSFATFSSGWNGLTDDERLTWLSTTSFKAIDRFGRSFNLTGKNLFISLNQNLASIGLPQINNAPLPQAVLSPTSLDVTISVGGTSVLLTFTPTPVPADTRWIVFATAGKSLGTSRPGRSQYKQIAVINSGLASPRNMWTEYLAVFGTPVVGTRVFIRLTPVSMISGQQIDGMIQDNDVGA